MTISFAASHYVISDHCNNFKRSVAVCMWIHHDSALSNSKINSKYHLFCVSFLCYLICAYLHGFVFRPGQCHGLSLAAMRRLLRLRVALAEFSLAVLEERCAEEKRQALARKTKTSAEIALEEFTRCPPEPGSLDEVRRRTKPSSKCVKTLRTEGTKSLGTVEAISLHYNERELSRQIHLGDLILRDVSQHVTLHISNGDKDNRLIISH